MANRKRKNADTGGADDVPEDPFRSVPMNDPGQPTAGLTDLPHDKGACEDGPDLADPQIAAWWNASRAEGPDKHVPAVFPSRYCDRNCWQYKAIQAWDPRTIRTAYDLWWPRELDIVEEAALALEGDAARPSLEYRLAQFVNWGQDPRSNLTSMWVRVFRMFRQRWPSLPDFMVSNLLLLPDCGNLTLRLFNNELMVRAHGITEDRLARQAHPDATPIARRELYLPVVWDLSPYWKLAAAGPEAFGPVDAVGRADARTPIAVDIGSIWEYQYGGDAGRAEAGAHVTAESAAGRFWRWVDGRLPRRKAGEVLAAMRSQLERPDGEKRVPYPDEAIRFLAGPVAVTSDPESPPPKAGRTEPNEALSPMDSDIHEEPPDVGLSQFEPPAGILFQPPPPAVEFPPGLVTSEQDAQQLAQQRELDEKRRADEADEAADRRNRLIYLAGIGSKGKDKDVKEYKAEEEKEKGAEEDEGDRPVPPAVAPAAAFGPIGLAQMGRDPDLTVGRNGIRAYLPGVRKDVSLLNLMPFRLDHNPYRADLFGPPPALTWCDLGAPAASARSIWASPMFSASDGALFVANGADLSHIPLGHTVAQGIAAAVEGMRPRIGDAAAEALMVGVRVAAPGAFAVPAIVATTIAATTTTAAATAEIPPRPAPSVPIPVRPTPRPPRQAPTYGPLKPFRVEAPRPPGVRPCTGLTPRAWDILEGRVVPPSEPTTIPIVHVKGEPVSPMDEGSSPGSGPMDTGGGEEPPPDIPAPIIPAPVIPGPIIPGPPPALVEHPGCGTAGNPTGVLGDPGAPLPVDFPLHPIPKLPPRALRDAWYPGRLDMVVDDGVVTPPDGGSGPIVPPAPPGVDLPPVPGPPIPGPAVQPEPRVEPPVQPEPRVEPPVRPEPRFEPPYVPPPSSPLPGPGPSPGRVDGPPRAPSVNAGPSDEPRPHLWSPVRYDPELPHAESPSHRPPPGSPAIPYGAIDFPAVPISRPIPPVPLPLPRPSTHREPIGVSRMEWPSTIWLRKAAVERGPGRPHWNLEAAGIARRAVDPFAATAEITPRAMGGNFPTAIALALLRLLAVADGYVLASPSGDRLGLIAAWEMVADTVPDPAFPADRTRDLCSMLLGSMGAIYGGAIARASDEERLAIAKTWALNRPRCVGPTAVAS